jgi:hypothetical protein
MLNEELLNIYLHNFKLLIKNHILHTYYYSQKLQNFLEKFSVFEMPNIKKDYLKLIL